MRAEALKGHLDGLLLASLEAGPRHGYAIMEALRAGSDGRVDLPTGTIYPALHRLERPGLVKDTCAPAGRPPGHGTRLPAAGRGGQPPPRGTCCALSRPRTP